VALLASRLGNVKSSTPVLKDSFGHFDFLTGSSLNEMVHYPIISLLPHPCTWPSNLTSIVPYKAVSFLISLPSLTFLLNFARRVIKFSNRIAMFENGSCFSLCLTIKKVIKDKWRQKTLLVLWLRYSPFSPLNAQCYSISSDTEIVLLLYSWMEDSTLVPYWISFKIFFTKKD